MSGNTPYPPNQGQPNQGQPNQGQPNQGQPQQYPPTQPQPTQQYPAQQPTQQYPAQQYPGQGYPQQPQPGYPQQQEPGKGGNRQLLIIGGAVLATVAVVLGLLFAFGALGGDDKSAAAAKPSAAPPPTVKAVPVTPVASPTATRKSFPKSYTAHDSDAFAFQAPSGWATKTDGNSPFFSDAPLVQVAQTNVAFWNRPSEHKDEQGFSVTELSATTTSPADFVNAVQKTTQRGYCANALAGAAPTAFNRNGWNGFQQDSGDCTDTSQTTMVISATRQVDGARLGLVIRGPSATIGDTVNSAMNAFDTYRNS